MTSQYSEADLVRAWEELGAGDHSVVYVISSLWRVPGFAGGADQELAASIFRTLATVMPAGGTIVVPTHSHNLCNTEVTFDLAATPSFERGVFSEYVRLQPGAHRSFHPFNSYAAVGPQAEPLTAAVSRHGYGPETPEARLIDANALSILIGLGPNITTTIHHIEHVMGVPYRYTKEFVHPVVRSGEVVREPFYMYVTYRGLDLVRSRNKSLFASLDGQLEVRQHQLGRQGQLHSFGMREFYRHATKAYAHDIYEWCATPPTVRPYQQ